LRTKHESNSTLHQQRAKGILARAGGTGTRDMIERCRKAGLDEPEFKLGDRFVITVRRQPVRAFEAVGGRTKGEIGMTPPVTPQLEVLIRLLYRTGALGSGEIRSRLGLKDRRHLRQRYIDLALSDGFIELTIPDKPRSQHQKYRLTPKGLAVAEALKN
jgi:ATP-dependent DNA helicase RecG